MKKNKGEILIKDFWHRIEPRDVYVGDLGWQESDVLSVGSDNPERIFRYYIEEVGYNMEFYYTKDGNFYVIFTEELPILVKRKLKDPNWDGRFLIESVLDYCSTHGEGEVIYSTDDASVIYDELKIDGVGIGDVLAESVIINKD